MAKSAKHNEPVDFEAAMGELETLVEKMERGEFSLEESIRQFERGIALARRCQEALSAAEQKVQKLVGEGERETLHDLDLPEQS